MNFDAALGFRDSREEGAAKMEDRARRKCSREKSRLAIAVAEEEIKRSRASRDGQR